MANLKVLLIAAAFHLFPFVASAQLTYPRGDQLTITVTETVQLDQQSGLYEYSYVLSSAGSSEQPLVSFRIATGAGKSIVDVGAPDGWRSGIPSNGTHIAWSGIGRRLRPGETLGGFSFRSPFPPAPTQFYALGDFEIPDVDGDDDIRTPSFEENSFSGETRAPSNPCAAGSDKDGDGICDIDDNCPFAGNTDQQDRGGVANPGAPTGSIADGIGDACQCGDANGDGRVTSDDSAALERCLDESAPACENERDVVMKCGVGGGPGCDDQEAALIRAATQGGTPLQNLCIAFLGTYR